MPAVGLVYTYGGFTPTVGLHFVVYTCGGFTPAVGLRCAVDTSLLTAASQVELFVKKQQSLNRRA
jgi:hypothetical protein